MRQLCLHPQRRCDPLAGTGGAARGSAADPRPPRRRGSFPREWPASSGDEAFLRCVGPEVVVPGIGFAEDALDLLNRHVGEAAALAYVLHVSTIVFVQGMEDRVGDAVEFERLDAKLGAEREVE